MSYKVPNDAYYARGVKYEQFWHKYPSWAPLYTEFEKSYDPEPVLNWMKSLNYSLPVISVIVYYIFIFYVGPAIMKDRPAPKNIDSCFAYWNLMLSVFSTYGVIRTVPHLIDLVTTKSFSDTVCEYAHINFGAGACGLAVQLFCLSKIPELGDTVFLVLKKKQKVDFLQWYHHITVCLYCWNSYITESSAGIYFTAMNYTVHMVMYFYFFAKEAKIWPKWLNPIFITVMQISQMFVGTTIVGCSIYFYFKGVPGTKWHAYSPDRLPENTCHNAQSTMVCGFIMYASYFYLFVEFAVRRFILKEKAVSRKEK